MEVKTDLKLGDCEKELKNIPNNSVDLIFTSPPYADQRKNTYGGIHPDKYVEWFLPISKQLLRVLKPTGTFILNIKEKVVNGERSTYIIELILEMPHYDSYCYIRSQDAKTRLKNLSETDKIRDESKVGSGFGKNISNWLDRNKAYPTNVLHLATECNNKNHSAAFPEGLPEWFIKLFTKEGDIVLDPFMGSGTTNLVAKRMKRNSIGRLNTTKW